MLDEFFSRVCVGSSTSALVSSPAERRSSTYHRRETKSGTARAARVLDDTNDDCETIEAQLLPGLLTWVLVNVVVDASSDNNDRTSSLRLPISLLVELIDLSAILPAPCDIAQPRAVIASTFFAYTSVMRSNRIMSSLLARRIGWRYSGGGCAGPWIACL